MAIKKIITPFTQIIEVLFPSKYNSCILVYDVHIRLKKIDFIDFPLVQQMSS